MTKASAPEERAKWLINTLYAQRSHFRDQPPPVPDDLRAVPSGEEGIIIQCKDGRAQEFTYRNLAPGEFYEDRHLGAHISRNDELEPTIIRGLTRNADDSNPHPRYGIITAHEMCGANGTLLTAQVKHHALTRNQEAEAGFMLPVAAALHSDGLPLSDALRNAHRQGVKWDVLHDAVTRSTALYSMDQLYKMNIGNAKVADLVDAGRAHIIGSYRGMQKVDGKLPLEVFDPSPDHLAFRPIEALYTELLGNGKPAEGAIKDRMKDMQADPLLFAKGASVSLGGSGRAGYAETIRAAQQKIIDSIRAL